MREQQPCLQRWKVFASSTAVWLLMPAMSSSVQPHVICLWETVSSTSNSGLGFADKTVALHTGVYLYRWADEWVDASDWLVIMAACFTFWHQGLEDGLNVRRDYWGVSPADQSHWGWGQTGKAEGQQRILETWSERLLDGSTASMEFLNSFSTPTFP